MAGTDLDFLFGYRVNACVGENGSPGYRYYAKGYSQASEILINTFLMDKGISWPVDSLVYPVCFNMRHSVELLLKGAFNQSMQHNTTPTWSNYCGSIFKRAKNFDVGTAAAKKLNRFWPLQQIAGWLKRRYPDDERYRMLCVEVLHVR